VIRYRTMAAAPARTGAHAWDTIVTLLEETLSRSPEIPAGSVRAVLELLRGLGPALIAGGHLERCPLVLVAGALELHVGTASGEDALTLQENHNPVPGGTSAPAGWVLHLPTGTPLTAALADATDQTEHLSTDRPPAAGAARTAVAAAGTGGPGLLDLDALRRLGSRS